MSTLRARAGHFERSWLVRAWSVRAWLVCAWSVRVWLVRVWLVRAGSVCVASVCVASVCVGSVCGVALTALGCAGAATHTDRAAPSASFSTHADPPPYAAHPEARATGEGPRGMASHAGADRARRLLVDLALAIRDADEAGIEALLAEQIAIAPAARRGHPAPMMTRGAWMRQLIAQARVAGLAPDTRFEELIVPESIRVEAASVFFPDGNLPPELAPGDLVVRFDLAPAGRRALGTLAPGGSGTLVVRPGDETRVIAR